MRSRLEMLDIKPWRNLLWFLTRDLAQAKLHTHMRGASWSSCRKRRLVSRHTFMSQSTTPQPTIQVFSTLANSMGMFRGDCYGAP